MSKDISRETKILQSIPAQSAAVGTLNGVAIDCQNFDQAVIVLNAGTLTTGTVDAKVQESDTVGGTYSDVTGAVFPQVTSANDVASYVGFIELNARKRFLRVVAVVGTLASLISADIILVRPSHGADGAAPTFAV